MKDMLNNIMIVIALAEMQLRKRIYNVTHDLILSQFLSVLI